MAGHQDTTRHWAPYQSGHRPHHRRGSQAQDRAVPSYRVLRVRQHRSTRCRNIHDTIQSAEIPSRVQLQRHRRTRSASTDPSCQASLDSLPIATCKDCCPRPQYRRITFLDVLHRLLARTEATMQHKDKLHLRSKRGSVIPDASEGGRQVCTARSHVHVVQRSAVNTSSPTWTDALV